MTRIFDILFSLAILIITLPLSLLIVIALLLFSPGNPFFSHERVGLDQRTFRLIKFRTMRPARTNDSNLTVSGDRRITPIGRLLRRLKLDELPQFINVLRGEMSLVGPRPEVPEFVVHYSDAERALFNYRPGLTDPATLKYRHEEKTLAQFDDPVDAYIKKLLPDKAAISLEYQARRTFWSDIGILWKTFLSIFR